MVVCIACGNAHMTYCAVSAYLDKVHSDTLILSINITLTGAGS